MDLGLNGLRALVTGSSRGLGYALALGLAREGVFTAINSRNLKPLNDAARKISTETGIQSYPITGDIADPDATDNIMDQAVNALGGLDLLVTNAGGPPSGKFESFDDSDWNHAIQLSLMSHVRLINTALPHLRQSQYASVLTVTSVSVKQPIPALVLSNSVRAATVGLTKTLALELGSDGIRFNSILPGWTMTERVHELISSRALTNGTTIDEEIELQANESPFGRMASPDEFANVAVFLLSPAASYITGVMLPVDGGMYKGTL